jgi:glycosyltransferase involved in cell wall biosynthesis
MKNKYNLVVSTYPQLTIIIPHFNDSYSLKELLETVPKTSEIQIIVIDDNSTELKSELEYLKTQYKYVEFLGIWD